MKTKKTILSFAIGILIIGSMLNSCTQELTPKEAQQIAKEAYIYANPMVDSYRIMYTYFIDQKNPAFTAPWNQLKNFERVYTSDDRTVQGPNSDTPYSFLGFDLRTEPIVLSVPTVEKDRYFSIQLIDLYTHIIGYIGSRTTGNDAGHFLLVGPGWKGNTPEGIDKVFHSETELGLAVYRTQLLNPDDIENVKKVQAGYKVQPLSAFLGKPAPKSAPIIDFIAPLTADDLKKSPEVFNQLNFILQFCPTQPSEKALMARFAKLDIGAGKTFDINTFSPEVQKAIKKGITDAWADFMELKKDADVGKVTASDVYGSREHLQNNYLYRMIGAVVGIWGNVAEESTYPVYFNDSDGQKLNGAHRYTLRFEKGQLPPVNSFWSITMYDDPDRLLVANPIDRYLLNSTMLSDFVRDADGGITIYIQHDSPGKDKENNWLPAPKGDFNINFRLYWPKKEALDGSWKQPALVKVSK